MNILRVSLFAIALLIVGVNQAGAVSLLNTTLSTPGTQQTLLLPPAADNSPIISLGNSVDPQTGLAVEGYAIIHHKKNFSHKPNHNPGGGNSSSCYAYLAQGAKWKSVEPWIVNPANNVGIGASSPNVVLDILDNSVSKWEDATDGNVTNGTGVDVLGVGGTTSAVLVADTASPDSQNEVYFADVSTSGAIAVTIVWGVFSGPPFARQLVEWDQVYDDVDFDWSVSGEGGKMDFDNIATHELGHSFGMGDLYDSVCQDETMYGYADYGETKKQTLNTGDITGVNNLY